MSVLPERDWDGWLERLATPDEIEQAREAIPEPKWNDPALYEPWTLNRASEEIR